MHLFQTGHIKGQILVNTLDIEEPIGAKDSATPIRLRGTVNKCAIAATTTSQRSLSLWGGGKESSTIADASLAQAKQQQQRKQLPLVHLESSSTGIFSKDLC